MWTKENGSDRDPRTEDEACSPRLASHAERNQLCACGSGRRAKRCCQRLLRRGAPITERSLRKLEARLNKDSPVQFELGKVGAERVRELLGGRDPGDDLGRMRSFEVLEPVPGEGVWLAELVDGGRHGAPLWVADERASFVFDAGNTVAMMMRSDEPVRIPPLWHGCEECQQRIAQGRRRLEEGRRGRRRPQ